MIKNMSINDNKYYKMNKLQNNKWLQFKMAIFYFYIF